MIIFGSNICCLLVQHHSKLTFFLFFILYPWHFSFFSAKFYQLLLFLLSLPMRFSIIILDCFSIFFYFCTSTFHFLRPSTFAKHLWVTVTSPIGTVSSFCVFFHFNFLLLQLKVYHCNLTFVFRCHLLPFTNAISPKKLIMSFLSFFSVCLLPF